MTTNTTHPFIISQSNEDPATLQARLQEWGYLYIRRYVKGETCRGLLQTIMAELKGHVALDKRLNLPVLTGEPFVEMDAIWDEVYPNIQSLELFHQFFHEPPISDLMKSIAGNKVFVYPMKMARISTPHKIGYETPPHQDARSHAAGPTMAGIWVALHDIAGNMGRLKILPRSHTRGVRDVSVSEGVGNVRCEIFPEETTWHVGDVAAGDVIIFHSATVHAAEANTTERIVRMSVDTRFCDYGAPVCTMNLEPHHGWRISGLNWQRIYHHWRGKTLQYYWQDYPNLWQLNL